MVDFNNKLKSFVDKAKQKITEIQNDEKLRDTVSDVVKQIQDHVTDITNDEQVKELVQQGKEKIVKLQNSGQQPSETRENPHLISHSLPENETINLSSDSGNAQAGEIKWTPSSGQSLSFIFMSELGIRAVSGFYPFCTNKIALCFSEITLLSFRENDNELKFIFQQGDGQEINLSFSRVNVNNHQQILKFIITHVRAIHPELEAVKTKIEQGQSNQKNSAEYLQTNHNKIVFQQSASYRGGIPDYPSSADKPGRLYVLENAIIFQDEQIGWNTPYNQVLKAELDLYQLPASRAFLAGGDQARMLQQVKNTVAITYLDQENIERTVKIQIHGALTIPGEAGKAQEFLNYLLNFKGSFLKKEETSVNPVDPLMLLKKLKELKDNGIITEAEFEQKKKDLLDKI